VRAQRPGQSALLFLDVAEILERRNVDYAVIGAFALSVHGAIRATMDVDAVISFPQMQLANLRAAFEDAGFQTELRRGDANGPISAMFVLRDDNGNQVELLVGLRGIDPYVFSRTVEIPSWVWTFASSVARTSLP